MPMIDPAVEAYAERSTTPAPPVLDALVERARTELPSPSMVSGNVVGRLLEMLVFATQPRLVLEIGTYGGTSAIWLAQQLPRESRIVTCDIDPQAAEFARAAWVQAGVSDRIELRMGPALDTIAALDGPIDLAFVDADKESYPAYLDAVLPKLSPRGVIVADNTLRDGRALDPAAGDAGARAVAAFNERAATDPALVSVLLTVRDGVTVIRRA